MLTVESLKLDVYLRSLVAQASFLDERLNQIVIPTNPSTSSNTDDPKIQERISFWCQAVAKGDVNKFKYRLAADGLEYDRLYLLLGDVEYPESQPLPSWAQTLGAIMENAEKLQVKNLADLPPFFFASNEPIPFEPFFYPFLQIAQKYLLSRVELDIFSEQAQNALWQSLLQNLKNIAIPTLFTEFSQFRSTGDSFKDFFFLQFSGKNSQDKYQTFLHKLSQDGLRNFFEKYPVLGRLLATTIEFWVDATAEFIERLKMDWILIEQQYSPKISLQKVVSLQGNLSDLHNQGRCAISLSFDSGLKLVYKPKDLQIEAAYNQVIEWCNQQDKVLPLKTFSLLCRGDYGWVEFVNRESCDSEEAVKRYYQRCGVILGLVYLLVGTDCHNENFIASGEYPVLIDLETLLTPEPKNLDNPDASLTATEFLNIRQGSELSVIRTMLLPQKGILPNDSIDMDLSAFGGVDEYQNLILKLGNINTDGMDLEYEKVTVKNNANAPKLKDSNINPVDYLEDLVKGFEQIYRLFLQHQQALLQPDSPLMVLAHLQGRYVFRSTHIYASILYKSYSPDFNKSGIERSIGLDALSRAFLATDKRLWVFPILRVERNSMEVGDIPFFTLNTNLTHLNSPSGEVISNFFQKSGLATMLDQVKNLSETDLAQQISIIYGTFAARFTQETPPPNIPNSPSSCFISISQQPTFETPDLSLQLLQQAINLAQQLQKTVSIGKDGSASWLGLAYRTATEGFLFSPLGLNLYDGGSGVALFLAALSKITGDSQWRELAINTLQPLRKLIEVYEPQVLGQYIRNMGIGGATGLGSIAYTLVHLSQFFEDASLLSLAQQVSFLMTPELIAQDRYLEITRGSAGAILGLLAVYAATQEKSILKLAITCGEHLLEHQMEQRSNIDGLKTWKSINGKALTGFSQGASGIAYALLRLWEVTQDEKFLEAAQEGIKYEGQYFSQQAGNWQDLRSSTEQYQISWAHGAPGIALARIGSLSILDTPEIRQEISIALETTQKQGIWGVDNLAWGNFGRIETLVVAAQTLNQQHLMKTAQSWSLQLIQKAEKQGHFTLIDNINVPVSNPGFFHGVSGIGYQLLRIACPELPSILMWESKK